MRPRKLLFAVAAVLSLAGSAPAYAADPCPNADVRAQQRSAFLPDCRAYEQVSATDKGGMPVEVSGNLGSVLAAVDGNAFLYTSWANFADAMGAMPVSYRARRTMAGWRSEAVSPAPAHPHAAVIDGLSATWRQASSDLSVGLAQTRDSFDPTDVSTDPRGEEDIYRTDAGQYAELISRGNGPERTGPTGRAEFATGQRYNGPTSVSGDGRHAYFKTASHLVPEDAGRHEGALDIYDRTDGETRLVNLDSDENLLSPCGSVLGDGQFATERAISPDGARVIFQVPGQPLDGAEGCDEPGQVYVRVDNADTVRVSASQRTDCATQDPCAGAPDPDPSGTRAATFVGASVDGRYVFVLSEEMLTDDAAGAGIYRYDMETAELQLFLDLTDTLSGSVSNTLTGVMRISADGSTVYFLSYYDLAPGSVWGQANIYVKREGDLRTVATTPGYSIDGEIATAGEVNQAIATPDGKHLLLRTQSVLGSFDHSGRRAVYLYDFDEDELTCVSCDPAGQRPSQSTVSTDPAFTGLDSALGLVQDRFPPISADGETVVFETGDRMVSSDVNSARDVYQYSDGRLHLISTGRDETHSKLIGMGLSGKTVFFYSGEGLVADDRDGNVDVYGARADGGFPEAKLPEPDARCAGDDCQPPAGVAPPSPLTGSLAFRWLGDFEAPASARLSIARVGSVRGGVARLRVRVPRGGRIVVSGRSVRRAQRRAGQAATYDIRVALSDSARRTLDRRGVVRARVSVRFKPTDGPAASRSLRLVFRSDRAKGGSGRAGIPSMTSREDR